MNMLIIKPSSLGDIVHALPFLKAVKDSFPEAQVDWVVSKDLMGVLEGNPLIHRLIPIDKDSWKRAGNLLRTVKELSSLRKTLKTGQYDIVVDLQGLLRSGLIGFFTPAAKKVGFADAREGSTFFYDTRVETPSPAHAVDRSLAAARAVGAEPGKALFPLQTGQKAQERVRQLLGGIKDYAVIVPSARWESKRWPAEKFASLTEKIGITSVVAGSRGDAAIAESIRSHSSGTVIDLCGRTNLQELVALISGARALISNDSGPLHIAAALNVPLIAVFGPTDPAKTGPYGWQSNKKMKVVSAGVPCSPCRRRTCRDMRCMGEISAEDVYQALKEYL
ncbi:MAG: lipopolysaccharide heptosyltransferase I [Nitrospiraceae bacterium]|nr:MAG: lipopolysaccharide heptosyltransferase I [Nitrospiraceae bacterium]